jgi:hypothetical protein
VVARLLASVGAPGRGSWRRGSRVGLGEREARGEKRERERAEWEREVGGGKKQWRRPQGAAAGNETIWARKLMTTWAHMS